VVVVILRTGDPHEDKVKIEEIYEKHKNMMLHVAMGILHDQFLAEDAVHRAFLRIINSLDKLKSNSSAKTKSYLSIVVRNVSIDLYNNSKNLKEISLDEIIDKVAADFDVEDNYASKVEFELLADRINNLPEIYRDVFVLKYYHDYSIKEISAILDMSINAIKKRLERARKHLKDN